jgi:hypothetical protein
MSIVTISRRSLIATGLAAGTAAIFAPAFAQEQMTAEKMKLLIDYTLKKNKENNKAPTRFSPTVTPFLFGSTAEVMLHQIGNDEGALKERFGVTINLSQQQVVIFSRTEDVVYFHRTGLHLRREVSAINKRNGGASRWTAPEASKDFTRQMSYWAGRSLS